MSGTVGERNGTFNCTLRTMRAAIVQYTFLIRKNRGNNWNSWKMVLTHFCVFLVDKGERRFSAKNNGLKIIFDRKSPVITVDDLLTKKAAFKANVNVEDANATTYSWAKVSGAGQALFSDAAALDTLIEFDAEGSYEIKLTATDAAGNVSEKTMSVEWDVTAPTVSINTFVVNIANKTAVSLSGTCSENGRTITLGGSIASTANCAAGTWAKTLDFSAVADGPISLTADLDDVAGHNAAQEVIHTFKDIIAPTVSLDPISINQMNASAVPLSGSCSENGKAVTIGGAVNGSATCSAGTWTASLDYSGQPDGNVAITVNTADGVGNAAAPVSTNLVKNTSLPVVTINNVVINDANKSAVTVSGDCSEDTRAVTIGGDVSGSANCASGTWSTSIDFSGRPDGSVAIIADHSDTEGNNAVQATRNLTKDTIAPTADITGAPSGTNNTVTMNITIGGADVVNYQYVIVPVATTCALATFGTDVAVGTKITENISAMLDGDIRLCVKGKDAAGNLQAVATEATWTKDTTAPTADITGAPSGSSNSVVMDITIGGAGVASYQYDIVSSATVCADVVYGADTAVGTKITENISGIVDGELRLCVKGKDALGNVQAVATERIWTKDTVAPSASLSGAPTGTSATTILNITVGGTAVSHYKHKIGVSASTDCSIATGYGMERAVGTKITDDISGLADGEIKVCVVGRDAAGNYQTEASAATAVWTKSEAEIVVKIAGNSYGNGGSHLIATSTVGDLSANLVFTIENTGARALNILNKVALSGVNPDEFEIVTQPAAMTIASAGSTTFLVRFRPIFSGTRSAVLTINNNDADEGTFTITLTGTGTAMASGQSQYVDIDNSAGAALTNYPVLVKLDTKRYIDNGWMQSDCRDLRFGNQSRTEAYPYWIEEGTCGLDETRVWVRVPSIAAASITTIYAHFNVATTAGSNGYRVFPFFDDFEDGVLDTEKWTAEGSAVESGGKIRFSSVYSGLTSVQSVLPDNWAMEAEIYVNAAGASGAPGLSMGQTGSNDDNVIWYAEGTADIIFTSNGTLSGSDGASSKGMVVGPYKITVKQSSTGMSFESVGATNATSSMAWTPNAAAAPIILGHTYGNNGYDIDVKYFAARPLANPEPTTSFLNRIMPVAASVSYISSGTVADLSDYREESGVAAHEAPQWYELDLGKRYTIDKVRLLIDQYTQAQTTVHEIYAGPTSNPTTLVKTISQVSSSYTWLNFDPATPLTNVRYIRILTTSTPGSWVAWREIEIYGKEQHTMFVTTESRQGDFGGLSAADAICQSEADAAGHVQTFKSILSTSGVNARTRVKIRSPIYNTNGNKLRDTYASLWSGSLLSSVGYHADGISGNRPTWTGTGASGMFTGYDCSGWTSANAGVTGTEGSSVNNSPWVDMGAAAACSESKSFYCLSETAATKLAIKGVTASSEWSNEVKELAIDGDPNTWWTASAHSGWLQVDLGRNVDVSKIRFRINMTSSGTGIVLVTGGKTPTPDTTLYTWNPAPLVNGDWYELPINAPNSIRYLRISLDTNPMSWTALYELEVYK